MNSISQVLHTKNKLVYNQQGRIIVHKRNAALIINSIMMNDNIVIYGHSNKSL